MATPAIPHNAHSIEMIELDEGTIIQRHPDIEAERASAIRDLLQSNSFRVRGLDGGPYYLKIGIDEQRQLVLALRDRNKQDLPPLTLSIKPFRRLIKDYFMICESYHKTFRNGDKTRLETIDMARRGLHNEGADILLARCDGQLDMDHETARCLFTLICILHIGVVMPW